MPAKKEVKILNIINQKKEHIFTQAEKGKRLPRVAFFLSRIGSREKLRSWVPVSIAWWAVGEGRRYLCVLKVHQAENWSQGLSGASWDLGLHLTAFKCWVLQEEKTFSKGELRVWLYPGFCRLLFCQDKAQRDGVSKPPLQMSGSDHVCGAGHCTCITHLSHHPPEEETHRAEMPSGASSFLRGKQRPVPVTQTRYLEPGQFLVSLRQDSSFWSPGWRLELKRSGTEGCQGPLSQ